MKIIKYLLYIIPCIVWAHPHTFIDVHPLITSKDGKIKNINFKWKFDEMTSQLLIMEFDQNADGKIDQNEIRYIKENYFNTLKQYNYYTNIKIKQNSISTKPENFKTSIEDGINVTYSFDITLDYPKKDIKIEIYDSEMFSALVLKDKFVTSNEKYKISDVDNDIYFGYRLEFE